MRKCGLLLPAAPDDAQGTLALPAPTLPPVNVRLWRDVLRWDSKEGAEGHTRRVGNIFRVPSGKTMIQVRPRQATPGWVLCAFSSGVPYVLCSEGKVRKMRTRDLWPGGKVL